MERVDVVVVGGTIEGLSAAWAAAQAGVRVIVVERNPLPRNARTLYGLRRADAMSMRIEPARVERVHKAIEVNDSGPVALSDAMAWAVVRGSKLDEYLSARARSAGAEVRDGAHALRVSADADGWRVGVPGGEPIRAPVIIVADGARSPSLASIGLGEAQRFSKRDAEAMTFLCATWDLDPEAAKHHDGIQIYEGPGPLGRIEVIAGKDSLTVAFGPVWRGIADNDTAWPSAASPGAIAALDGITRRLSLPKEPRAVEIEEIRLDALPSPATFDGGVVIGTAAGHRRRDPLLAGGGLFAGGQIAGAVAAKAVHAKAWSAKALADALGEGYDTLASEPIAELAYEAHGLRRPRLTPVPPFKPRPSVPPAR